MYKEITIKAKEVDWEFGDVFEINDFIQEVEEHGIMNSDGIGYLAKREEIGGPVYETNIPVLCNPGWLECCKEDFNYVCWYNK